MPRGPSDHRWEDDRSAGHDFQVFSHRPPTYMLHPLLGDRPQGSNRTYTLAFVGYGIFTVYMTVCHHDRGWYMSELAGGEVNLVW